MAVQTNIALDYAGTSVISLHGWYYSDSGTPAVRAEFYCNGSKFATEYGSSSNWTTDIETKSGLNAGTSYSFAIKFYIADGRLWGSASANYSTASLPPPPGLPSNPQTTITNGNTATISFTKGTNAYFTHMDIAPYAYSNLDYTNTKTTTGTSITWNGLLYNTRYYTTMKSEDYYAQQSAWTTTQWWFDTGNAPLPEVPSSPPTITGRGIGTIDISWGAGIYADYYKVAYKNTSSSTWIIDSNNWGSLTATITGLLEGTSYDFKVCSENNVGSSAYTTVTTGYTLPDIPTVQIVGTTATTITIKPTIITGGYQYIQVYEYNSSGVTIATVNLGNNEEYTFTGLTTGALYKYNGRTYYNTLYSAYSPTIEVTTGIRPINWVWTTSFYSGKIYAILNNGIENYFNLLPALEWNNFLDKIAEFRTYCGLPTDINLYHLLSGSTFDSLVINRAINSINDMNTHFTDGYATITQKTSSSTLDASTFLLMRDTLNSIL